MAHHGNRIAEEESRDKVDILMEFEDKSKQLCTTIALKLESKPGRTEEEKGEINRIITLAKLGIGMWPEWCLVEFGKKINTYKDLVINEDCERLAEMDFSAEVENTKSAEKRRYARALFGPLTELVRSDITDKERLTYIRILKSIYIDYIDMQIWDKINSEPLQKYEESDTEREAEY